MVDQAKAGIARADADVTLWSAQLADTQGQVKAGIDTSLNASVITKSLNLAKASKVEAEAAVQTALAQEKVTQARRDRAAADVEVAKARVETARAALKTAEALKAYTEITAPFAGVVTGRHVHPGHLLQAAGSGPGTALFHLARTDVVRVFADIPEVSADRAGVGTAATVRVPALGGREYAATVTRTTGIVDPGTRTLRVEIDLDNKDGALKAGLYATVRINAEASEATVLPAGCVLAADETHYIYLVEGGKAVKYRVQLGRSDPGTVQVLGRRKATATAGAWDKFTGAEQVVEGNLGALTDGADVRTE
jgi:HlyD family secretion protein